MQGYIERFTDPTRSSDRYLTGFIAPAANRTVTYPCDPRQRNDAAGQAGQLINRHGYMMRRIYKPVK